MLTIIPKDTEAGRKVVYIHTEDEREFDVTVSTPAGEYTRNGFSNWFDAYEHGRAVAEAGC
jgi:hypothetical protein